MTLTPEQVQELKSQLFAQVQNLPLEQRQQAEQQIKDMGADAIETMLNQQVQGSSENKTIFRMLVDGDIPSNKIDENKDSIAVLDINPISKGHALIIPKDAIKETKDFPEGAFALAKKVSKSIIENLNAKTTEIQTEQKFGEITLHVIPIYDSPLTLNSPRQKANDEELTKIAKKLKPVIKKEIIKVEEKPTSPNQIHKLNRRIP